MLVRSSVVTERIGNPDTLFLSRSTGENGWQPQAGTHPSIFKLSDESALDVGPSDLVTSGLSNPGVTGLGDRHSALPMQAFSVGLSRSSRDDGKLFAGEVGGICSLPLCARITGELTRLGYSRQTSLPTIYWINCWKFGCLLRFLLLLLFLRSDLSNANR